MVRSATFRYAGGASEFAILIFVGVVWVSGLPAAMFDALAVGGTAEMIFVFFF